MSPLNYGLSAIQHLRVLSNAKQVEVLLYPDRCVYATNALIVKYSHSPTRGFKCYQTIPECRADFLGAGRIDDIDLLTTTTQEHNYTDFLMVDSGCKAFSFLEVLGKEELPKSIIVNRNLPALSGYNVIRKLKATEQYRKIPVLF